MDLHPLFVHFPVALLTVYAFLEVIRRWTPAEGWRLARTILVVTGTAFAFVSLSTGEGAEHAFQKKELFNVLELHSLMATVSTWTFAILAICYIVSIESIQSLSARGPLKVRAAIAKITAIAGFVRRSVIADCLAILGFITLGLVGALGGILAYGPDFDPITHAVYSLLF